MHRRGGGYLNPAVPAAADYVVQGVAELVQNYPVDGIHFDDYFYPTTDAAVDAAQFAASGAADLAAWRRQNVTALVAQVHRTVKAADPTLRFGISPQGNPDNDLATQYSDVYGWLAASGEEAVVDYLVKKGVDRNKLTYSFYGMSRPLSTNDTDEGRAMNRRVEFTILNNF